MKKLTAFVLSIALLLPSLATETFAATIQYVGNTTMTIQEFEDRYVGENVPPSNAMADADANIQAAPSIEYSNIVYDTVSRNISFDASICVNGRVSDFNVEGTLYSSYKADLGINSIVGDLEDTTNQYEVLRFEIYNDQDLSRLYAINTPNTATTPTLILYLRDGENLYLFETAIPTAMSTIIIPNTPDCRTTEGSIDGFWFQNFIEPEVDIYDNHSHENFDPDSSGVPLAEDGDDRFQTVNATWMVSGVEYNYFAKVKVQYYFTDVNTNDSTWELLFGIADAYSYVDGVRSNLTGLRITNVDMSMVSGPYTRMLRAHTTFNLHDSYDLGGVDTLNGLASVVAGSTGVNAASVAADIFSILLDKTLETNKLTNNCTTLLESSGAYVYGRAFRYYVPDRYFLQHTNNKVHFEIVTRASRFLQSTGTSGQRTGIIEVSFDYYVGDGTTTRSSSFPTISGNYYCDLS